MATRAEVLAELGLAPTWRLRTSVAQAEPASAAGAAPVEAAALVPMVLAEPAPQVHDTDATGRLARIAALDWPDFAASVDACNACGLCRTRNRSVPGVGDRDAQWLFVGEAPGAEEDSRGEPFVGQAGRLLDNMLVALGLARNRRVYIANVLKCRPPDNRTPTATEAAACRPYLERQIALIQPQIIVALGKSAANLLLARDATIASLRGTVHRYGEVPLVVTYHPAYLLRTLGDKAKAWEDLLLARQTVTARAEVKALSPPLVAS